MSTLIPALSSCKPRMTSGERRFSERLESELEDEYLLWYEVAVGSKNLHPDFICTENLESESSEDIGNVERVTEKTRNEQRDDTA